MPGLWRCAEDVGTDESEVLEAKKSFTVTGTSAQEALHEVLGHRAGPGAVTPDREEFAGASLALVSSVEVLTPSAAVSAMPDLRHAGLKPRARR